MLPKDSVRVEYARSASTDEINSLLYEADEEILVALLENPQFQEKHAEFLASRVDVSSSILSALAESRNGKWMGCESVRLRLGQHPHTPKRIAMAAVRQLFLFDLVRLNLLPSAPPDIRRFAEQTILARVPHLPVGEKLALARRGPARVAAAILAEGHPQALKLALANGLLTESQVLKTLAKDGLNERVVAAIAQHPKWSRLYNVRVALLRTAAAPLNSVQAFIGEVTLRDLTEIVKLREVSAAMSKLIARELERRKDKGHAGAASSDISGLA
jgi:hypothetical protein